MQNITFIAALLAALTLTTNASASLQIGSKVKLDTESLPGGQGGQFGVSDPGGQGDKGFDYFVTFCVELEQTIGNNGVYFVHDIALENSSGKSLGAQAAYLYTQFRSGAISANTAPLANGLQYGIWLGMGYTEANISAAISGAEANYKAHWNANKGAAGVSGWLENFDTWSGIGNVRVMQLGDSMSPPNRQDQLVILPEASTIAIWSVLSLVGASVAYRKRNQLLA